MKSVYVRIGLASMQLSCGAAAQPMCEGNIVRVASDDVGDRTNLLFDLAVSSSGEAIAIGNWQDFSSIFGSQAQRLANGAFVSIELPDASAIGTLPMLEGVGLVGEDIWTVGTARMPFPIDNMPFAARWSGTEWELAPSPVLRPQNTHPFSPRGGIASDVAGVSGSDFWVIGSAGGLGDGSATSVAMALHWDGSDWVDVPVPIVGNRTNHLDSISASAPDNVWAVGDSRDIAQAFKAMIVRWNGQSWESIANPGQGPNGGDAEAVLALAPDDVWVSGSFNNGADKLIHWDGSGWTAVESGAPGQFAAFAATGPGDIWASCALNATLYHFDGMAWTAATGPEIPGSAFVLRGWGLAVAGPCELISVGGWSDGVVQRTLVERLVPADCPADTNGDGALSPADFSAWIAAFNAMSPSCDQNGDSMCTPADFSAWIANYNAGC